MTRSSFAKLIGVAIVLLFVIGIGITRLFLADSPGYPPPVPRGALQPTPASNVTEHPIPDRPTVPLVSANGSMVVPLNQRSDAPQISVHNVTCIPSDIRIVAGRAPRPNSNEAIVGASLRSQHAELEAGRSLELAAGHTITIVGVFEASDTALESEVLIDAGIFSAAFPKVSTETPRK